MKEASGGTLSSCTLGSEVMWVCHRSERCATILLFRKGIVNKDEPAKHCQAEQKANE